MKSLAREEAVRERYRAQNAKRRPVGIVMRSAALVAIKPFIVDTGWRIALATPSAESFRRGLGTLDEKLSVVLLDAASSKDRKLEAELNERRIGRVVLHHGDVSVAWASRYVGRMCDALDATEFFPGFALLHADVEPHIYVRVLDSVMDGRFTVPHGPIGTHAARTFARSNGFPVTLADDDAVLFRLLASRATYREVADRLHVHERTVQRKADALAAKLGLRPTGSKKSLSRDELRAQLRGCAKEYGID